MRDYADTDLKMYTRILYKIRFQFRALSILLAKRIDLNKKIVISKSDVI